ncbi:hypothetical protein J3R82DRAFT_5432, partial [Butyriboletus roseoflavus]
AMSLTFKPTSPYALGTTWLRRWAPALSIWGAGAGTAALFVRVGYLGSYSGLRTFFFILQLLSVTPLVKNAFLVKVPLLGSYYEDKTPASDKPF